MSFSSLILNEGNDNFEQANEIIVEFDKMLAGTNDYEGVMDMLRAKHGKIVKIGGTRIAFLLENIVLKFARTKYNTYENKIEIKAMQCSNGNVVPKLFDYQKSNYYWLIVEKVSNDQATIEKKVLELFPGIASAGKFFNSSNSDVSVKSLSSSENGSTYSNEVYARLMNKASEQGKDWLKDFFNTVNNCGIRTSDLSWFNWGVSTITGRLVPIDLGN